MELHLDVYMKTLHSVHTRKNTYIYNTIKFKCRQIRSNACKYIINEHDNAGIPNSKFALCHGMC